MFAATTSPWYLPTWVSGQMPVTSPIAHSRSPARRCASTGMPAGVGLDADRLQADPLDPRPPAGGDQQAVAAQLAAVVELQHVVLAVAPRGGRLRHRARARRPSRRSTSPSASPSGAGSRGSTWSAALDQRDLAAEPAHRLRHLDADRPAAEHEQPARDGLHAGHLAVRPEPVELAQSRDRRHDRVGAGRHDDVLGGVALAVDLDHAGPGQPAAAAQQVDARCSPASAPARRRSSRTP